MPRSKTIPDEDSKSIKDFVINILSRLRKPSPAVPAKDFHQTKLLSNLLLVLIPLSGLAFILTLLDSTSTQKTNTVSLLYLIFSATIVLIIAFMLTKTKYYGLAFILVVGVISGSVLASVWIEQETTNLYFLALGILFSSFFHSWRGTLFWFIAILAGMYLASLTVELLTFDMVVEKAFFLITIGVIAILYTTIQNQNIAQIEERSGLLASSEQTLLETQSKLEIRVKERTADLEEANNQLNTSVTALKQLTRETVLLAELGELLHACTSIEEAGRAIGNTIPQLFPDASGRLYVQNASHEDLEPIFAWGLLSTELEFQKVETNLCWALRRGRLHRMNELCTAPECGISTKQNQILCIPMSAHGETMGVLHLSAEQSDNISQDDKKLINEQLAITSAEHIGLAIANLKLREKLLNQSVRDGLTGLFNRRYLDQTLERELQRAERTKTPLGVIVMDIDHFKNFNDAFGHDAGDAVLREFGVLLNNNVRGSDIACRYGGEEFVLILPDASLDVVLERAESICSLVKSLLIPYRGQKLGPLTISIGVALFPEHETTSDELMRSADQALYKAKKAGRDQVVVANIN